MMRQDRAGLQPSTLMQLRQITSSGAAASQKFSFHLHRPAIQSPPRHLRCVRTVWSRPRRTLALEDGARAVVVLSNGKDSVSLRGRLDVLRLQMGELARCNRKWLGNRVVTNEYQSPANQGSSSLSPPPPIK